MNSDTIHNPPNGVTQVLAWYQKAQIDYADQFLKMYVAYNAWYYQVTGTNNDRQALSMLKKRFVIWDDYCNGKTMAPLKLYMEKLVELTQRDPLVSNTRYWNGEIDNTQDWRSLIEYWYQIRCLVVHGAEVRAKYVWLAYETLDTFMCEILDRIKACLDAYDYQELKQLSSLAEASSKRSQRFQKLQDKLYQKYIAMPDIWQVDMQRAKQ